MFLRGFNEVIAIAVVIVGVYLLLNVIVLVSGLVYLAFHPSMVADWYHVGRCAAIGTCEHEGQRAVVAAIAACLIFFPKLALGLSGFETGVAVMPLVRGEHGDDPHRPRAAFATRASCWRRPAIIMSCMLLGSSIVTAMLIDPMALHHRRPGGQPGAGVRRPRRDANCMINPLFGAVFGTIYDISTVAILWFAGASAMSGLLNLVPRYLPRFGMAPRWAEAVRSLVIALHVHQPRRHAGSSARASSRRAARMPPA